MPYFNEDTLLEFFFEQNQVIGLNEIRQRFPSTSEREILFAIVTLVDRRVIERLANKEAVWKLTEKAIKDFEAASARVTAEEEKDRLTMEKLRYDVSNAKRIFKTYWWTFAISIAAFLLAVGKIIYDLWMKGK